MDSAFGRSLRRLAEGKATYELDNFFRLNNNIAPRTQPAEPVRETIASVKGHPPITGS